LVHRRKRRLMGERKSFGHVVWSTLEQSFGACRRSQVKSLETSPAIA
jgi:hypothetical protein